MPFSDPGPRLRAIVENIERIRRFIARLDYAGFASNDLVHYGVVRALEIISEASRHLPADLKARYPDVPWRNIADAGNVYRHIYDRIDLAYVWHTATVELDGIARAALTELASPQT